MIKARGIKELKKHLLGERLTLRQMVIAKCADCTNWYGDGKIDCEIPDCPLYPMSPYGKHMPFKSQSTRTISPQHLKALMKGRIKGRKEKAP